MILAVPASAPASAREVPRAARGLRGRGRGIPRFTPAPPAPGAGPPASRPGVPARRAEPPASGAEFPASHAGKKRRHPDFQFKSLDRNLLWPTTTSPQPDDEFDQWFAHLVTYLTTNPAAPTLPTADKTALTAALADWGPKHAAYRQAQLDVTSTLREMNDARTPAEALARRIIGDVQRDADTTDAQRTQMQIPIPKGTRTPTAEIPTWPIMTRIDTSTRLRHRLFFADSDTPEQTAKPDGAKFCEIREQIGGEEPEDGEAMPSLAMESRQPHRNDFEPADKNKPVFYCLRWVDNLGRFGKWSPVYSAGVPEN